MFLRRFFVLHIKNSTVYYYNRDPSVDSDVVIKVNLTAIRIIIFIEKAG